MLFRALLLSLFLTANPAFGQGQVDRRALVEAAFENFVPLIYFLSGSETFLEKLTPEERAQFEMLGKDLIPRVVRADSGSYPGRDNTSRRVNFQLRFSSNSQDFVLKPGEPERTAKVTQDVWFNLNLLNRADVEFTLLDAFQIMFHEFGHKLEDQKKQEAIDRVAAKIRDYIRPFYRDTTVVEGFRVSTLTLPYLMYDAVPVDLQPEPVVLLDRLGKISKAFVNVPSMVFPDHQYIGIKGLMQEYKRVELSPNIRAYDQSLLLSWDVQVRHFLVQAPIGFNYMPLFSNPAKAESDFVMTPMAANRTVHQLISYDQILSAQNISVKNYATNPTPYTPSFAGWIGEFTQAKVDQNKVRIESSIESSEVISEITFRGQNGTSVIEFPGTVEKVGESSYRVSAEIPRQSPDGKPVIIQLMSLNGSRSWDLAEPINVQTEVVAQKQVQLATVFVWDGKSWVDAREIKTAEMATDDVRMKFLLQSSQFLSHLEITWSVLDQIVRDGATEASRLRTFREVISDKNLVQRWENGMLVVEVISKKASEYRPEIGFHGYQTEDSGYRSLIDMMFVTKSLGTLTVGNRIVQTIWRSLFKLPKNNKTNWSAVGVRCGGAHL